MCLYLLTVGKYANSHSLTNILVQAQWKAGKRRAEKDELIAAAFLTTLELPGVSVDIIEK